MAPSKTAPGAGAAVLLYDNEENLKLPAGDRLTVLLAVSGG